MNIANLNPILNQPKRLAALGILANSSQAEFSFIRDTLELKDPDLSKQMKALDEAGYIKIKKTGKGSNRQTWYKITKSGKTALDDHIKVLNMLVNQAPVAPG